MSTCTFVNARGERCITKPQGRLGRNCCGRHSDATSCAPCRFCKSFTRSPKGVCTACQRSNWWALKKEKDSLRAELEIKREARDSPFTGPKLTDTELFAMFDL